MAARKKAQKKRRQIILICAAAVVVIAALAIAATLMISNSDNDYDGQMNAGQGAYAAGDYEAAEAAFKSALSYQPNDPDAMYALSDTYVALEKYTDAVALMKTLNALSPAETEPVKRLLSLYIEHTGNIAGANELILGCYESGMDPGSELVAAAPVFDPAGGEFGLSTDFTITAAEGLTIYYTEDGSLPTESGNIYEKAITVSKNGTSKFAAIAFAENGLMSWPATAEFTIDIKYSSVVGALDYIGKTARTIQNGVGALYFKGSESGGYYYQTKSGSEWYVFPIADFAAAAGIPDGEIVNPETVPLPPSCICSAVLMSTSTYVRGLEGDIAAEDLMHGLGIKDYTVGKEEEADGTYKLMYKEGDLTFYYDMKDEKTVLASGTLWVINEKIAQGTSEE
jgi:tetratricopeptide (TPR) repeat protein